MNRSIHKSLVTMEDLAQGLGKVSQKRGGKTFNLGKVNLFYSVTSENALQDLDVNKFNLAQLDLVVYAYDSSSQLGIKSNKGPGSWLPALYLAADSIGLTQGVTLQDWANSMELLVYVVKGPWSDIAGKTVTEDMRNSAWDYQGKSYGVYPSVSLPVTAPADPTTQPTVWRSVEGGVTKDFVEDTLDKIGVRPSVVYDLDYANSVGTDNKAALQDTVDAVTTPGSAIGFGKLVLDAGAQLGVASQLFVDKKSLIIEGNNAIVKWLGNVATTDSIIRVDDSSRCKLTGLVLAGNLDYPPFAALRFYRTALNEVGTNENHKVEHVIIGRRYLKDTTTGGSADDTPLGKLQNGIVVDGVDGNNDEYVLSSVQVHSCENDGISFKNTQSIWSRILDCLVNDCNVGIRAGCNLHLTNPTFNRNKTADVYGIRDIEVQITGFNSENAEVFTLSEGGASFFINGGELQMNRSDVGYYFKQLNGGSLSVVDSFVDNIQGTPQKVYYRAGSVKPTYIYFRPVFLRGGELRDNWDIDSSNEDTHIDISYKGFKFKTNKPYADREVTPGTAVNLSRALVGSGYHHSPLGELYNTAYLGDVEVQHLIAAFEQPQQIRANIVNVSGATKTLGTNRMRWLNLSDKVSKLASKTLTVPLLQNFTSHKFDVTLLGARVGDFIEVGCSGATMGATITGYVTSDNSVDVVVTNVSGGPSALPELTFTVGVVPDFGNRFGNLDFEAKSIADNETVTYTVPCVGSNFGSHSFVAASANLKGMLVSCNAKVDAVQVVVSNFTGATVSLSAGTFRVMCAI